MLARAFVVIGGLVVLALLVALVAPFFVDWTSYRASFEREASAILGRPVTVAGKASARLLPFPSVTFTDVRVGAGPDGQTAMTIEAFSMDAELAPFLSGNVLIFDMRIDRPRATVVIGADGTVDWARRPAASFDPAHVALENVTITDGEIIVRHGPSGRDHVIRGLAATLSAKSLAGPFRMAGEARFDRLEAGFSVSAGKAADGDLRLLMRVQPKFAGYFVETDGDVRLENGKPVYGGSIVAEQVVQPVALRDGAGGHVAVNDANADSKIDGWRAKGEFVADASSMRIEPLRLETGPRAEPYVADGTVELRMDADARFDIALEGHQVRLADPAEAGSRPLPSRLADLADAISDAPRPALPGSIRIRVPAIVAGDTTLREVSFDGEAADGGWTIRTLSAQLPGRTTVEAKGFLATGETPAFSGDVLLAIGQPSGFATWLGVGVDEAIRRLPRAGFSAKANVTRDRQALHDMEAQLGEARFRGAFERDSPADRDAVVKLDLDGGALDLAAIEALASLFTGEDGAKRLAEGAFDLSLRAGPVDAGGIVAERIDTALRLAKGRLDIDRLLIDGLAGAHVSATASIEGLPAMDSATIDGSIIGDDLSPLAAALADRFPQIAALSGLARRANDWPGLLADGRMDFVATVASADGARRHAISAHGVAGGTTFTLSAAGVLGPAGLVPDHKATFTFEGTNADAAALVGLCGLPALPLGLLPAGRLTAGASGRPMDGFEVKFALEAEDSRLLFDGAARPDGTLAGSARLASDDLTPWLMTTGLATPGLAEGITVDLTSDAAWTPGALALDNLAGTVGDGTFSGATRWRMKDGRPHGEGRLAMDRLDLPLAARALFGEAAVSNLQDAWSAQPFAASATVPITGVFDVATQAVTTGWGPALSSASMRLNLDGDSLAIADLNAAYRGGRLTGFGELRNSNGDGLLSAQFALDGAPLPVLFGSDAVAGVGKVSATLTASGKTAEAMAASLAGSGVIALGETTVSGLDSAALGPLLAAADVLGPQISAEAADRMVRPLLLAGATVFGPSEAALTIASGVARAGPVTLTNPKATLSGEAYADLARLTAGVSGDFLLHAGEEALAGAEPLLRISAEGPFGRPVVIADTQPIGQFLVQRALEKEQSRVEALQAALAEKQRLRREVRYYAYLASERARIKAEETARIAAQDEARRAAEAERLAALTTALKAAEAEATRRAKAAATSEVEMPETAPAESEAPPPLAKPEPRPAGDAKPIKPAAAPSPETPLPEPAPGTAVGADEFPEAPKPERKSTIGTILDFLKPKGSSANAN